MKFYSFYTNDIHDDIIKTHRLCCNKYGVDISYHVEQANQSYDAIYTAHGDFMTNIVESATDDDVVCFLDVDCLPHNGRILTEAYEWAKANKSFIGNAQNISHTVMRNRLYAAASMLIISKAAWIELDKPSFSWFMDERDRQIDTAQLVTLRADDVGLPYRLMFPIGFDEAGGWQLGSYGRYGKGTLYPATWHYFRISALKSEIPELWRRRVGNILNDETIFPLYPSLPYGIPDWKLKVSNLFYRLKKNRLRRS